MLAPVENHGAEMHTRTQRERPKAPIVCFGQGNCWVVYSFVHSAVNK